MSAVIQSIIRRRMDEVRAGIRSWLMACMPPGVPVVDENQYKPEPKGPYVSFGFVGGLVKLGRADSFPYDKAINAFKVRMHRQATLTINAFGKPYTDLYSDLYRATDILSGVQACIDEPTAYTHLQSRGIAIWGDSSVQDRTELKDNVYYPRATLDLILGVSIEATIDPGYIETVRVTGRLDADFDGSFEKEIGPFTIELEDEE